jgi:hypothetical protein
MSNRAVVRQRARRNARQKIAAQRAARQRRRRLLLVAGGSALGVLAIAGTFVLVKMSARATTAAPSPDAGVVRAITTVPASTLNAVGRGTAFAPRATAGHQPPLTSDGKPEVLYVGAEYCPFCAAERWALTVALSRFGTFSGLRFIHSSPTDYYPNTPALSFYGSSYTSRYLVFTPVEMYTVSRAPLQAPTAAEAALVDRYDAPPYVAKDQSGAFPFVDLGNQALIIGAQYLPAALDGLTWSQVAAAIRNPHAAIAREVDGAANMITAELCRLTHGRPGHVCASAGVKAAAATS